MSDGLEVRRSHQPLIIDPKVVRPLPPALWGHACSWCDKMQSVWEVFEDGAQKKGQPVCSLCWLYQSDWGRARRTDVDKMLRAVELTSREIFRRDDAGRLWSCSDADRILASIAVTSRVAAQRALMAKFGGTDGT